MTEKRPEQIEDKYGTVLRHRATCDTCGRTETADGSAGGYKYLHNEFAAHIDDGTACHGYRIDAIYEDGGERRVA